MVLDKNIELIIFDFDGTIFDLNIDWKSFKEVFQVEDDVSVGDKIHKFMAEGNAQKLQQVTAFEIDAVANRRLAPETAKVLDILCEKYEVAILTRNSVHAVKRTLTVAQNSKIYVSGREDVQRLKPDPEGLDKILNHFHISSKHSVLVGDTYHDVETAHARGLKSIIVKNPTLQYIPQGADYYIDNLAELLAGTEV